LSRTEVRKSLSVELHAGVTFGFEQSQGATANELLLLAESALNQNEVWQEDAEPQLAQLRRLCRASGGDIPLAEQDSVSEESERG
jgi:hypothetical protein